jgi:putative hydrolase of the HAD superfamily
MDKIHRVRYYKCVVIKAVGFDLDGTLYPGWLMYLYSAGIGLRHPRLLRAFGSARRAIRFGEGKKPEDRSKDDEDVLRNFRTAQASIVAKSLSSDPGRTARAIDEIVYSAIENKFRHIKPYGGVPLCLRTLRASGLRLGLLSDLPPFRKIELMGLRPYFDTVLCSEHSGALKPSPLPFSALAEGLRVRPEEILYVGNKYEYDIVGARMAGMKTALIGFGKKGQDPDFSFLRWEDLTDWVLRESAG